MMKYFGFMVVVALLMLANSLVCHPSDFGLKRSSSKTTIKLELKRLRSK